MNFQYLRRLARTANPATPQELYDDREALRDYWRRQCEIENAKPGDYRAGLALIDEIMAGKRAALNYLKTLKS